MRFLRFLIAGGLNTATTYVLYLGLLQLLPYPVSYTISFAFGILLSYTFNVWFVFSVQPSSRSLIGYPIVYSSLYLANLGLIALAIEVFGVAAQIAPLVSAAVVVPITFLALRRLLVGAQNSDSVATGTSRPFRQRTGRDDTLRARRQSSQASNTEETS